MFGRKEFGLAAAAALAACGPAEKAPDNLGLDSPESASVMKDNGDGTIDITLPEEGGAGAEVADSVATFSDAEALEKSGMPATVEELQKLNTQEVDDEGGIPPKINE